MEQRAQQQQLGRRLLGVEPSMMDMIMVTGIMGIIRRRRRCKPV
jgi:hypothetical protein